MKRFSITMQNLEHNDDVGSYIENSVIIIVDAEDYLSACTFGERLSAALGYNSSYPEEEANQ